jgi:hypothetical protein
MVLLFTLSIFTGCSTDSTPSDSSDSGSLAGITPITVTTRMRFEQQLGCFGATTITLNGNSILITGSGAASQGSIVTIKDSGTYVVSGQLTDGNHR